MRRPEYGFTLLEVLVALAILALSMGALLSAQSASLNNAEHARDITIATLLTRSKMIDIEKHLYKDGFTVGDDTDDGDFGDDEHPEIKWSYKISAIKFDLSSLTSLCGGFGKSDDNSQANDCQTAFSGLGGMFEGFTQGLANSVRAVALTVSWPEGRYKQSMQVHALMTQNDFKFAPVGLDAAIQAATGGQGVGSVMQALGGAAPNSSVPMSRPPMQINGMGAYK